MTETAGITLDSAQATAARGRTVLVLSADLGGGHDALAAGLKREVAAVDPSATVVVENGLRIASAHFNEFARESYRNTVERTPWTYQLWFWVLSATAFARIMRWAAWRGLRKRIQARIEEVRPDVVVSTYPFMTAVLGKLRREGALEVPAVGLLIDSGPHDLWIAPGIDLHVTMNPTDCDRARDSYPTQRYYPPLHITSARPAVDERCYEEHDRDSVREAFGLPLDKPVLLISGGSWGLALPDDDVNALIERTNTFLAIACGRNDELADKLEQQLPAHCARIIRFTTDMPALLSACDAALLNAGGMTCYECFALGTPVVLYEPLPGHGVNAARALDGDGLANYARTRDELIAIVSSLDSDQLQARAHSAQQLRDQQHLADVILNAPLNTIPPGEAISTTVGRTILRNVGLIIVIATILGLAASIWSQRTAIQEFDWSVAPAPIIIAVMLFSLGPLTQSVAFWVLLRMVGVGDVRLRDAMAVWSWSSLARYAPTGAAAFIVRVRETGRLASTRTQVLAASAYEQLLVPISGAVFSALAFAVAGSHIPGLAAAIAIGGVSLAVAVRPRFLGNRILAFINRRGELLPQLPKGRGLATVIALNLSGWFATGAAAATALEALGQHRPEYAWVLGAYSFAWLAGYITPLSPGGIGVREAVLTSMLAPHYGVGVAVSLAIGMRIIHTIGDLMSSATIEVAYRTSTFSESSAQAVLHQRIDQLRGRFRIGLD